MKQKEEEYKSDKSKESIFPDSFMEGSVEEDFALSMLDTFAVVASVLGVFGFGLVNAITFHGIILEFALINIAVGKKHDSAPIHGVVVKLALVLGAISKAVGTESLLDSIDKGAFVEVSVGVDFGSFAMGDAVFKLSTVDDFGLVVGDFVEGGVVESVPLEGVGDLVEVLGLEGLAAG